MLEFFMSPRSSGFMYGEEKTSTDLRKVATSNTGEATFDMIISGHSGNGAIVTATAADPQNGTAEFPKCATARP